MNISEALDSVCDVSYPITDKELLDACDATVEAPDGSTFELSELVSLDGCPSKFESEDDLRLYLQSVLPEGSVGRKNYDDRGTQQDEENLYSL